MFFHDKAKSLIGSKILHASQRILALFYDYSLRFKISVFNYKSSKSVHCLLKSIKERLSIFEGQKLLAR